MDVSFQTRELPEALGNSEAFLDFQSKLSRVAAIDRPILIIGERGTGKELAANRLHFLSKRWDGPLVSLNCASLGESVLESELFGHEAGSFTGANKRREGRFEQAEGGTLFLDEIGLVSMSVQEKILRAVEYGMFERVGSSQSIVVDARIIGATNANLVELTRKEKFKSDLLDRLSFEVLHLPPLRYRSGDIAYLATRFAASMSQELEFSSASKFTASAMRSLESYEWPGNVRELKNVVERSVYRSGEGKVDEIDFAPFESPYKDPSSQPSELVEPPQTDSQEEMESDASFQEQVRELEIRLLKRALEQCRRKQTDAAESLGLSYHQFRALYRKYKQDLTV
ncbi:phage shock protein operon transcriptional activator [Puniceicoccaceae bacterium K14]|nr:phage shock protein operon transcriptional activator [Puniceicoccaceae bacterium K14]